MKDLPFRGRYNLRYTSEPPEGRRMKDSVAVSFASEALIATAVGGFETLVSRMALVRRGDMP